MNLLSELLVSVLLIGLSTTAYSQQHDEKQVEQHLTELHQQIYVWGDFISKHQQFDQLAKGNDSLNHANQVFRQQLQKVFQDASTITYKYNELTRNGVDVTTAPDNHLKIVSWMTARRSQWHSFENVAQYIDDKGISHSTILKCNHAGDPGYSYSKIDQLQLNGKIFYFVHYIGIYPNDKQGEGIQVMSIDGDQMNEEVKLFKTASGLHSRLYYEYNFAYWDAHDELLNSTIHYEAKTQTILIPVVQANGQVTKKFITYKFTGQYFEKGI